ncbi:MAG: N-acetylglucosamine-6-phosphate deacetylase [Pyrinomonadaceae bacterium]
MKKLLLQNSTAILPNEKAGNFSVLVEQGIVAEVSSTNLSSQADEILDFTDTTLYAGFIDIHNHGAIGVDVNTATADDLHKVSRFLATKGVTAWLPTFVPDSDENYKKVVDAIDEVMQTQDFEASEPAARILGIHYEGVFANEKMCGALRPEFFKTFRNGDEINDLPKLKNGIHLTTLAPEVENGIGLIKELRKENWIVSIGHTKADFQTLENAFNAGARHLTHFFNAMTGLHHREIGVAGWGLANKEITFDIIADGVHVHPAMLKFACQSKTPAKTLLISDSVAPTGLGDGEYEIWDEKIFVRNGKTQNERGSIAGSVITMLDAVKMLLSLGFSEAETSQMASANPAKLLDLEKTYGSIEVGKRADLVILDERQNVKLTLIGGKIALNNL